MCIVLVAYQTDINFPLVIAANRDEFFARPSLAAHFWSDFNQIFAGRDKEAGGTWLGVTPSGRFAAVTNWTDNNRVNDKMASRGWLVRDFLSSESSCDEFIRELDGSSYQGFNLLVFDGLNLVYWSNRSREKTVFEPGFYGITNTHFKNSWAKTRVGVDMIGQVSNRHDVDSLIQMLRRHTKTNGRGGATPENEESPCFVFGDTYGTRASTAVVFDGKRIFFKEQQYGPRAQRGPFVYECIPLAKENGNEVGTHK